MVHENLLEPTSQKPKEAKKPRKNQGWKIS